MCIADGDGLRGPRPGARAPPVLAEWLRRVVASQEATVEAALTGDRDKVGRGDAARPARRPHRLRPRRADDRRDARGDQAAGSRSSRERARRSRVDAARRSRVFDDVADARASPPRPTRRRARRGGDRRTRRRERHARHRQLAARVPRRARRRTPTSTGRAVTAFHMDEYVGHRRRRTPRASSATCASASPTDSPLKEFHYLDGDTGDAEAEARPLRRAAPRRIRSTSAAAGIGENGHLAFNDPPVADFDDPRDVKVVALEAASRRQQVGEGHFATIDDVPTHAITVTIPALLRARRVLAIVPEARKAAPVRATLRGPRSRPRARRRSSAPNRTRRSTSTPNRPRSSARKDVFEAQRGCRTRRTSNTCSQTLGDQASLPSRPARRNWDLSIRCSPTTRVFRFCGIARRSGRGG